MAVISFEDRELIIRVHGLDIVLALRQTLRVPLRHIEKVRARPTEAHFDHAIRDAWRGIGTYMPGRFAMGTAQLADCVAFFAVHDPERTIAIDLLVGKSIPFEKEAITRIVVELDDESPEAAVQRITRTLESGRENVTQHRHPQSL